MSLEIEAVPASDPKMLLDFNKNLAANAKEIVLENVMKIGEGRHVKNEGWLMLALLANMTPSVERLEVTPEGVRAEAVLRRDHDGAIITRAFGYCGKEETLTKSDGTKYGRWAEQHAIEAMAQTRAISRVCANKFRAVVKLIDKELKTTPAEEMISQKSGDFSNSIEIVTTLPPASRNAAGYYRFSLEGKYCWSKDAEIGALLDQLRGVEVLLKVQERQKDPKKAPTYQILSIEPISAKGPDLDSLDSPPDDIPL